MPRTTDGHHMALFACYAPRPRAHRPFRPAGRIPGQIARWRPIVAALVALLSACGDAPSAPRPLVGTWDLRSVLAFPTTFPYALASRASSETTAVIVVRGTLTLSQYGEIRDTPDPNQFLSTVTVGSDLEGVAYSAPTGNRRCAGATLACWEGFGARPANVAGPTWGNAFYRRRGGGASSTPFGVRVEVDLGPALGSVRLPVQWDPTGTSLYDSSAAGVLELRRRD